MLRRVRTTKKLAKRIDLQYFTKPHPFRRWRLWLSILVPVVALAWFAALRANGQKIYSAGPLSASHAVLGKRCEVCHVTTLGIFRARVNDNACLKCHDAPAHHVDKVTFTPACGSCHTEHKGSLRLASTSDSSCTQCHAELRTRTGTTRYVQIVKGFDQQHPEFAVLRLGASDPGQVKLNHYAHLRSNLAGPDGPVQMDCQDCHRLTTTNASWPYAMNAPKTVAAEGSADIRPSRSSDGMWPILYANQCAGCHVRDLQFDKRFDQPAPHDKPEVVQAFLVQKYSDYFASHPRAISEPVLLEHVLPGKMKLPLPVPHTRQEWIDLQVMLADRLLFDKGCKLCHIMIEGNTLVPAVAKSSIPERWLLHANFSHNSHRLLSCVACHSGAPDSRDTKDVLLPGIASCRNCHQEQGAKHDAANGNCSECHSYHDWNRAQPTKGKYLIPQLRAEK